MNKREIKFRAWDRQRNWMADVISIDFDNKLVWTSKGGQAWASSLDGLILLQFTGLLDKNGKEIWEHDIVTVEYGKGKVIFNAGCFMIEWIDDKEANMEWLGMYHKPFQLGRPRKDLEVVGNIYSNPELLK